MLHYIITFNYIIRLAASRDYKHPRLAENHPTDVHTLEGFGITHMIVRLWESRVISCLWVSSCLAHFTGISPEVHRIFNGRLQKSPEFHRNVTRISPEYRIGAP